MSVDRNRDERRPYRMRRRLDGIEETRRRITAAAFELHASIGPSRTSVKAIAERAGVQRHTVYAHFPDLDTLYAACTAHGIQAMAMPDPTPWERTEDATERLRRGLAEVYAWYRSHAGTLERLLRDPGPGDAEPPPSGTAVPPDPYSTRMAGMVASLAAPWSTPPADPELVAAVVAHALAFDTWRSLAGAGVADDSIVALMAVLVAEGASGRVDARHIRGRGRSRTKVR